MPSEKADANALSANFYDSEILINTLLHNFNMADFQQDYKLAVEFYDKLGGEIQKLSNMKVSKRLTGFMNQVHSVTNCDRQILLNIDKVVGMYQAIENEAEQYVRKARNFAQENHLVAENVKAGKQFFDSLALLENFDKTARRLDDVFKDVINKHSKVAQDVSDIHDQVGRKRDEAKDLSDEAEIDQLCTIPVLSLATTPVVRAFQFAEKVSNPYGKVLAGCAGFVAGILGGALSTAFLGLPMAAAHFSEKKFTELREEYGKIQAFLKQFDNLVKQHKDLLSEIRSRVSVLTDKYKDFKEDLERGEDLKHYQINLFQMACGNVTEACDIYLAHS